jgi:hypothetical protein
MDLSHLSAAENDALMAYTKAFKAKEFENALQIAEDALSRFPDTAYIWHNQIGVLIYEDNPLQAFFHYKAAFEGGFDAEACEYNIWEVADIFFKSMQAENGKFNAIMFETERPEFDNSQFVSVDFIPKKYLNLFPEGEHLPEIHALLEAYQASK